MAENFNFMTEKLKGTENATKYVLKYNLGLPRCPVCNQTMESIRPSQGKYVLTLKGLFHQWIWKYICINEKCPRHTQKITFGERLDYGNEQWGKDLLELIGEAVLNGNLKTSQIQWVLKKFHQIELSEHIIGRMTDDVLILKANQIDQRTVEIISQKKHILLGIDGQDPDNSADSIWALIDLESDRLLRTIKVDSANSTRIHEMIEETLKQYDVELIGVVSDKQSNIRKCIEDFYPQIPHQYCTFHFFMNIWRHLEKFDNQIHTALKSMLKQSSFYKISGNKTITVDDLRTKASREEVFEETRNDIIALCGIRSKTFERLHGLELYHLLQNYSREMEQSLRKFKIESRLKQTIYHEICRIRGGLNKFQRKIEQCKEFFKRFQQIYETAYRKDLSNGEIKKLINHLIEPCWIIAQRELKISNKDCLGSFLPTAQITWGKMNGELVRLWEAYKPGLFAYENFPIDVRTNVRIEKGFGTEKQRFISRHARKKVGFLIQTRGELVLRLSYAMKSELERSIIENFDYCTLQNGRSQLNREIKHVTDSWQYKNRSFTGPSSMERYSGNISHQKKVP